MARQPINIREQQDVPGRLDLNPTLGNLFAQAGQYVKDNAMGGMFRENAGEEFAEKYAEFDLLNPKEQLTEEQRNEIGMRTMDMLSPVGGMAGTVIGVKSVSGQRLLDMLDKIVPGSKKAYMDAPRIRQAISSGDHVPEPVRDTLKAYDKLIDQVEEHKAAKKILDMSGFTRESARHGVLTKAVSDEMTTLKPHQDKLLRGIRKKFKEKPNMSNAEKAALIHKVKMTDIMQDSVIQREYPDLAKRVTMEFGDLGSLGRRGSMDAHFLDTEPDKIARGKFNLITGEQDEATGLYKELQPGIPKDRWLDKLLGTVVHEGDHAVAGYEGMHMLGANFNMNTKIRRPATRLYNMIKQLPEEDVPKMGETVMRLRKLADAGLDVFDAVYRSQAAETTARSAQRHFLGEGPLGKYTNEGFDSLPPEWFAARGLTPEDMVFTPSMREFRTIHSAAGGTKATPEGKGVGHLYEKLYKGD